MGWKNVLAQRRDWIEALGGQIDKAIISEIDVCVDVLLTNNNGHAYCRLPHSTEAPRIRGLIGRLADNKHGAHWTTLLADCNRRQKGTDMEITPDGYAAKYMDKKNGWFAVPRWLLVSPLWNDLKANQRAILLEIYRRVRRSPMEHEQSGRLLERGQAIITHSAIARATNTTREQVRPVINRLRNPTKHPPLVTTEHISYNSEGHTQTALLVTWLDFDAYDEPSSGIPQTPPETPASTPTETQTHNSTSNKGPASRTSNQVPSGAASPSAPASGPDSPPPTDVSPPVATPPANVSPPVQSKAPSEPEPEPEPKPKRKSRKRSGGRNLEPHEIEAVCRDSDNMGLYLRFGQEVVNADGVLNPMATDQDKARRKALVNRLDGTKGTAYNWLKPGRSQERPRFEEWTITEWAGLYWFLLSVKRQEMGVKLTLPIWGKLNGTLKNLVNTMPPADLYQRIKDVTYDFDVVCQHLGPVGQRVMLDETTIINSMVANAIMTLPPHNSPEREDLRRRARRGGSAPCYG